jgi:flagellar L-ring protein precursor FlgH
MGGYEKMKRLMALVLSGSLVMLAGCATSPQLAKMDKPIAAPARPEKSLRTPKPATGSLFVDRNADLFSDLRAKNVGDIVIVEVVENSKAKKKADTKAERTNEYSAGIPNFLGYESSLVPTRGDVDPSNLVKADFTSKHDAKASMTKEDSMTTSIGCTVMEVLPGGNLLIRGSREIQVAGETQHIILEGKIRPSDVTNANTVFSTQLADARIFYTGRGVLTDKQKPGWLARLLDTIWPF